MSDLAERTRDARRVWARPRSGYDRFIKSAMIVLPASIGVLAVVMLASPLLDRREVSFVLAKDKVDRAPERLRASQALYRGTDKNGRPFEISAGGALQATSKVPVVALDDLSAQMAMAEGPATLVAPKAQYNMTSDQVDVVGPLNFRAADGYTIATRDVTISLHDHSIASSAPVSGTMRLGTFSGGRLAADLDARTVTLSGGAHLHIVQGAARAR